MSLCGRTARQDYDGCGRFSLTLNPTTEPIDSLQIRIPLRLSEAYLTHTVTDYIRENYAGSIPSGARSFNPASRVSPEFLWR